MRTVAVSLVIPHRNRWNDLRRCLDSLSRLSPLPQEIIVVDDASKAGEEVSTALPVPVKLINLEKHRGTAAAKNEGVRAACGEYVWFLDSDTEVIDPGMLLFGMEKFSSHKRLAGLGGEGVLDEASGAWNMKVKSLYANLDTRETFISRDEKHECEVEVSATCNLLMPRRLFVQIGGFNPRFEIGEDKDLCLRLRAKGYVFVDSFRFLVWHRGSSAHKETRLARFFIKNHVNQLMLALLALPLGSLCILPILDLASKYRRFNEQTLLQKRLSSSAHGPQARVMAGYRSTFLGKMFLYSVFACTLPLSYARVLLDLPRLLFERSRRDTRVVI